MGKILIRIIYFFGIFIKCNLIKKNLIFGAIKGYDWEIIKPFFISLYKANFKECDCVIFVCDISKNTTEKLKSMGVIIHQIPEKYKGMKINNVRYKLYEEYLSNKLDIYNMVLHADVRDTFFQKDLFQLYENKGSFIGISFEEGNISETNYNSKWMKAQYGDKIYEILKNEKIICSGTIWGTVDRFYELVQNIWEEIVKKSPYDFSIHDQTVTNYLIYHKKLFKNNIITSDIYTGPVMTVGLAMGKEYPYDIEDNLLNIKDKFKASVIHQYDRIPKLLQIVEKKYGSQNETKFNTSHLKIVNSKKIVINSSEKENFQFLLIGMISCLIIRFILKNLKK